MKTRPAGRSLGLTASIFAAMTLAANDPVNAQLPGSSYVPNQPGPASASPQINPAPPEELLVPPRPLPLPMSPQQETLPLKPGLGGSPSPSQPPVGSSSSPSRSFRDRWHYCMQEHFWGFASEFRRPPLGYFQYQHGETEVANGTAVFMTLYHYDFEDGTDKLNLHGRDQLAKIATLLPKNFCPIVIERTPKAPALAEARRAAVLNELSQGPFPVPAQRVVIGPSLGDDLRGVEAQLINMNVMIQTLTRGSSAHGGALGGSVGGGVGGMGVGALEGGIGGLGGGLGGFGGGLGSIGGGTGGMGGMGGMGAGGLGIGR